MENQLSTVIVREHNQIGASLAERVVQVLYSGNYVIESYAVDTKYVNRETLRLKLDGDRTLTLAFEG